MLVAAGDQIVADGETLDSKSLEVDESLLTGESVPVIKAIGDQLLSGSFVVAGSGMFRTTAVGADSYAQRLTREGKQYVRLHSDLVAGINSVLRVIGIGDPPGGSAPDLGAVPHGRHHGGGRDQHRGRPGRHGAAGTWCCSPASPSRSRP